MDKSALGEFSRIAQGIYLEGLSVDSKRNVVWYSDPLAGGIYGVKPDGAKICSFNESRKWTGGVMMNDDGAVLSTGPGGIMWNHPDTGKAGWLLNSIEGKPINGINEMWPDGTGGIYFGTSDIEMIAAAQDTRPMALYRLTCDRRVIKMDATVYFSNGIGSDPDRKKFYCSDTFRKAWVWDVADDMSLSNQQVLLEKDDCDGLSLDIHGNIWITGFRSPGIITRVTPNGEELSPVATPTGTPTQVRFGGDGHDYYITVVASGGGDSVKEGRPLASPSYLYRGRSEIPGVVVVPARFRLD